MSKVNESKKSNGFLTLIIILLLIITTVFVMYKFVPSVKILVDDIVYNVIGIDLNDTEDSSMDYAELNGNISMVSSSDGNLAGSSIDISNLDNKALFKVTLLNKPINNEIIVIVFEEAYSKEFKFECVLANYNDYEQVINIPSGSYNIVESLVNGTQETILNSDIKIEIVK